MTADCLREAPTAAGWEAARVAASDDNVGTNFSGGFGCTMARGSETT